MSRDLKVRCDPEILFEAFCEETKLVAQELCGGDVPPVIVENAPGHETHWRPKLVDEGPLIAFQGVLSSVDIVPYWGREIDGKEEARISIDLPWGHSPAAYVLAVSAAVALARMNDSTILDDPGYFTPQG